MGCNALNISREAAVPRDPADRIWLGYSLETLIYHELRTYNQASAKHRPIWFYPLSDTEEVNFLVETRKGRPGSPAKAVLRVSLRAVSHAWLACSLGLSRGGRAAQS